jgi:hypothetical protein
MCEIVARQFRLFCFTAQASETPSFSLPCFIGVHSSLKSHSFSPNTNSCSALSFPGMPEGANSRNPSSSENTGAQKRESAPLQRLDHNHEEQQSQRSPHLEATRR